MSVSVQERVLFVQLRNVQEVDYNTSHFALCPSAFLMSCGSRYQLNYSEWSHLLYILFNSFML